MSRRRLGNPVLGRKTCKKCHKLSTWCRCEEPDFVPFPKALRPFQPLGSGKRITTSDGRVYEDRIDGRRRLN